MLPNSKRIKQWAINIDYSWFVQFWKSQLSVQRATTTKKKRFLLEALINHCSVWGPKSTGILPKLKLTEVPCQLGHPVNFEFKKISVDLWNDTTGCSSRLAQEDPPWISTFPTKRAIQLGDNFLVRIKKSG